MATGLGARRATDAGSGTVTPHKIRRWGGGRAAVSAAVGHGGAVQSIVLEGVGVAFGGRTLFGGIGLTVSAGRCTAVAGPSGAGKTTLLRLLNRLGEPSEGRILLDGVPIDELDVLELRRRVGLVPQHPVLLSDVVVDEVRVGRPSLWDEQVGALLNRVGLPETFLHRRCAELSGGEAQRVCLARALAVRPEVLLLDEPTSALDEAAAEVVGELIRAHCRSGGSVVLVSHDSVFTAAVADDILLLEGGRLSPLGALSEAVENAVPDVPAAPGRKPAPTSSSAPGSPRGAATAPSIPGAGESAPGSAAEPNGNSGETAARHSAEPAGSAGEVATAKRQRESPGTPRSSTEARVPWDRSGGPDTDGVDRWEP
ncbi:ABC transporter ATP-binding protein [Nocardia wallacei]|uniref:ABC transporter ATP-binding protein n=1 Tax=Nocardia wallacei TaxID=480035 RepID=UPI001657075C|nr:ATP-binding cassette domain-containing protein [Nocardia wallacei]